MMKRERAPGKDFGVVLCAVLCKQAKQGASARPIRAKFSQTEGVNLKHPKKIQKENEENETHTSKIACFVGTNHQLLAAQSHTHTIK